MVRIAPPWIGNPAWGSKTDQSGLPPDGKYLTLAEVKTEDESTQVMTVTIGGNALVAGQGSAAAFGGPISALIDFGTAGAVFQMVVDVFVGTQFSIAASWIRVGVLNEAFLNPATTSQLPVQASASISMLPTTKANPITKTIVALSGAGAVVGLLDTPVAVGTPLVIPIREFIAPFSPQGLLFAIPPFAKSLIVHSATIVAPFASGSRLIEFLTSTNVIIGSYAFAAGVNQLEPIDIPNGTVQIRISALVASQRLIPQFFLQA